MAREHATAPDVLVFGAVRALLRGLVVVFGLAALGGFVAAISWLWGNISISHGYLVAVAIVFGLIFVVIGVHWGVTTRTAKLRNPAIATLDQPRPQKAPGRHRLARLRRGRHAERRVRHREVSR